MRLIMTDDNSNELFTANVLLPEAWQYTEGTAYIEIDAMQRQHDAHGKFGTIAEAFFELHGSKQELKEFLQVMMNALDEAQTIPTKKTE
ncbi:TPA: hypothetical protein HA251_05615 [Candidatus Woesearchaeota archaeon]|nr:hypothetical protein [Candidatus Woesearchaeota archaeon]